MNKLSDLFQINGVSLYAPDGPMQLRYEDIDAADSGRDESGVMHRIPVRHRVRVWEFSYARLSREEYAYMLAALPRAGEFTFTHPGQLGLGKESCKAYVSNFGISWFDNTRGEYRNLKFNVIEC